MSIKPKDKILTYEQARELKWFCKNVVGVRADMYDTATVIEDFNSRISRLERTCKLIESFLGEKIEANGPGFVDSRLGKKPRVRARDGLD